MRNKIATIIIITLQQFVHKEKCQSTNMRVDVDKDPDRTCVNIFSLLCLKSKFAIIYKYEYRIETEC